MAHGRFKKRAEAALCLCLFLCMCMCGCARAGQGHTEAAFAMGSVLTARIYASEKQAHALSQQIFADVTALDGQISATDENAALYKLNAAGRGDCGKDMVALLRQSVSLCEELNGAIDITLGRVTALWGFATETPRLPADDEIKAALATVGLNKLSFSRSNVTLGAGQALDLGAIGKGAGCDKAKAVLDTAGVPAVLSFGGTVLVYGQKPGGSGWTVGVRDPGGTENDCCATITLTPEASGAYFISTSGSYEKTFTEQGRTYHHIIDPATGYPVQTDLVSVTAVSESGYVSDALSTALFVNGLNETSLAWADRLLTGAVFIFEDGGVYVTRGLKDAFTLTDTENYHGYE